MTKHTPSFLFSFLTCLLFFGGSPTALAKKTKVNLQKQQSGPAYLGERENWGTDIIAGVTLNKGNVEMLRGTLEADLFRRWNLWTTYLESELKYGSSGEVLTRFQNQGEATLRADRKISSRWRVFAFTTHAYNEFSFLDLRSSVGAGPSYEVKKDRYTTSVSLAFIYEFEKVENQAMTRFARGSLRHRLKYALTPYATLGSDLFYIPILEEPSDFRFSFSVFLETKVFQDNIAMRFRTNYHYDSRPSASVEKRDLELIGSFRLSFGE